MKFSFRTFLNASKFSSHTVRKNSKNKLLNIAGSETVPHTGSSPTFPLDISRHLWLNLKFYQKGLHCKHKFIYQMAQWTLGSKGAVQGPWIHAPHEITSAVGRAETPWAWACACPLQECNLCTREGETLPHSFQLLLWLLLFALLRELQVDPVVTHTCRSKFQAPIWTAFRAICLAAT